MRLGWILFLAFTVVPAVETWGIIQVGSRIGATETVLWLIGAGVLGAWLGRRAGLGVLREVQDGLARGVPPADKLVEGVLVLVGSVLLVTPGVLTDLVGLALFIAPVRRWLAPRLKRAVLAWLTQRGVRVGTAGPGPAAREAADAARRFDHPIPRE
jgi:UPF0716 protein FxsA